MAQLNGEPRKRSQATAGDGPIWALGLMSGTSMDGVDAALVRTDGLTVDEVGPSEMIAYDKALRARLRAAVAGKADDREVAATERLLTERHAEAVHALIGRWGRKEQGDVGVVGFHGHTLWHRPAERRTRQIGNGALLARLVNLPVVNDFRAADLAAGGEGAPLAPLYHLARAEASGLGLPVAVLNLGGVANVTWIGPAGDGPDRHLLAFDTGPGCAMIDDWALRHTGVPCDIGGGLAAAGTVDGTALGRLLDHPYFARRPPKSLDRFAFPADPVEALSVEAGAATLTAFAAEAVARAAAYLPALPRQWLVTGGGRHNKALMAYLARVLGAPVRPVETAGWNGDSLEAEAFAFLAVRSLRGLPLSLPATTGARAAVTGGRLHRP
ncbi:MAG TPA: anhydro-N-acetylmuramic acid kinase [Alphaproteobacteria bacterium]|jgi:anhydro-N-acetylmuramic acid kinase